MFCPDCGQQTPEGKRFCIHCGADIESAVTPVPGSRPTPPPTPPPTPGGSISDEDTALGGSTAEMFKEGDVIDDRYEVVAALGQGGMGAVYHVRDRSMGEECALKAMHPHLLASEKAAERFVQEVRLSRKLTHDHIVRVHHLGQWGGLRYLTMELLEGITLRDRLKKMRQEGRQVHVDEVVSIVGQVLDALSYAHESTVHRDIKPENIFLQGGEGEFVVKLLDFGIAKALDADQLTSTTTSMGTAYYVAPEQLRGDETVDARADLYAVGVVLYEMLTGELPTGRFASPSNLRDDLDEEWDEFILGAMEREAGKRPADAAAMADGLRAVAGPRDKAPVREPAVAPSPAPDVQPKEKTPSPASAVASGEPRAEPQAARRVQPVPKQRTTVPPPKPRKRRMVPWIVGGLMLLALVGVAGVIGIVSWFEEQRAMEEPQIPEEEPGIPIQDPGEIFREPGPDPPGKGEPEIPEGTSIFEENPFGEEPVQGGKESFDDLAALFRESRDAMERGDLDEAHELLDAYESMGGDPALEMDLRQEIFRRSVESVRHLVPGEEAWRNLVRAYGGLRPESLRAYKVSGALAMTQQGITIDQEYLVVFPDRIQSTITTAAGIATTTVNGNRGVMVMNGRSQPAPPELLASTRELLRRDLYHMAANSGDPSLTHELMGTSEVNGETCEDLRVVWDGVESRVCVAGDGRALRIGYMATNPMTQEQGINMVIVVAFQRTDGRVVPMESVNLFNGQEIGRTNIWFIEFNPRFDESIFRIP